MGLESCCLCAESLLELQGQFLSLRPYALRPGDEDIRAAGVLGPVHASCLIASPWGARWARRLAEHAAQRGATPLGRHGSVTGLWSPGLRQVTLIQDTGYRVSVPTDRLSEARPDRDGLLVPVEEEYNLELADRPDLVATIQDALTRTGRYPLLGLIDALGMRQRLAFPAALQDGWLLFDPALRSYWRPQWLSMKARYHLFVPADGVALLRSM